jgi:hypothetical protein
MESRQFSILVIVAILIALAVLYSIGMYFGEPCSSVAGCRGCWSAFNDSEKNNVYVDMISCACTKANARKFADSSMNREIEDRYFLLTGTRTTADSICRGDEPLIKYE